MSKLIDRLKKHPDLIEFDKFDCELLFQVTENNKEALESEEFNFLPKKKISALVGAFKNTVRLSFVPTPEIRKFYEILISNEIKKVEKIILETIESLRESLKIEDLNVLAKNLFLEARLKGILKKLNSKPR